MRETKPRVIVIPAKPELAKDKTVKRQLRVAAYCRVSTDDEEQLTSYEAQQTYYTDKIMTNPQWTMAGIFADEGITGTSAASDPAVISISPLYSSVLMFSFSKMIAMLRERRTRM